MVKTKTLQIKFGTCFSSYLSFSSNSLPPNSVLMLWITLSGSKKSRHPYWRGIRWCKVGCQISSRVFMQGCGQAWGVVVQAVWQIHAPRQPGMRYQSPGRMKIVSMQKGSLAWNDRTWKLWQGNPCLDEGECRFSGGSLLWKVRVQKHWEKFPDRGTRFGDSAAKQSEEAINTVGWGLM